MKVPPAPQGEVAFAWSAVAGRAVSAAARRPVAPATSTVFDRKMLNWGPNGDAWEEAEAQTPSSAHSAQASEYVFGELPPPVWVKAVQYAAVVVPSPTAAPPESLG